MPTILAIDWGSRQVGTALGNTVARIGTPHLPLANDADLSVNLQKLIESESVERVIVGLPRNLEGEETAQSEEIRAFATQLADRLQCPVLLQDETLSTQAGQELRSRYPRADKDSLAAAVILQDYLETL
ncbi:MAG: Holliday junction resolvase RuvX [Candidatus Saccharimonadales bacterium]